jgi:GTPase SAR1 family protein
LYTDGEVDADHVKLFIVGDEEVGKTTMAIAMGVKADPTKRTAGIEVHKVNEPEFVGPVLVYDVAGHKEFHGTHALFLGGVAVLFALIIKSNLTLKEILDIARYWMAFVVSARRPEDSKYRPYMLIVGSYGDAGAIKEKQRLQLGKAMKVIYEEFKDFFNFVRLRDAGNEFVLVEDTGHDDEYFPVLDCREKNSADMRKLMGLLGKVRAKCLELVPKVPVVCKRIRDGVLAEQRLKMKIQEKEEFRALALSQSNLFEGDDEFGLLIEHLTEHGEVVDFNEKLVIDVPWLCLYIIGSAIADRSSGDFYVALQPDEDGSATKQAIGEAFKLFSESKGVKFNYDIMWGINILCHLRLCLEHPKLRDVYIFPCHIKKKMSPTTWQKEISKPVYVGRRIQCCSLQQIITPGSFPVIQCEAKKSETMLVVELWDGGMKVQSKNVPYKDRVEALVEIPDKRRFIRSINIIIRGPTHSHGDCVVFLKSVIHLIMSVLDVRSPGTITEKTYMSYSHICQHTAEPDCYTEKEIKETFKSNQVYVTHDGRVQDSLIDLLAVENDHMILLTSEVRSELCEIFDFPDEGQPDTRKLSKALGIRYRQSTSEVLEKWCQDVNATVSRFADVLKTLNPPATDALRILAGKYGSVKVEDVGETLPKDACKGHQMVGKKEHEIHASAAARASADRLHSSTTTCISLSPSPKRQKLDSCAGSE